MTAIPPTTEPVTRTAAAERMRRHRQRRRDGLRCLVIELRETEIDVLIRKGLLNLETRNDTSAIIDALCPPRSYTGVAIVTRNDTTTA
jgi:hypothetical protein